jgi:hypothetical protein
MEKPVKSGKIHSGKSSQMKILNWLVDLFQSNRKDLHNEYDVKDSELLPCSHPTLEESVKHGQQW